MNPNWYSIKPFYFLTPDPRAEIFQAKEARNRKKVFSYNIMDLMLSFLL